eukprot:12702958-Alexandrium_andersonii.AAC.1
MPQNSSLLLNSGGRRMLRAAYTEYELEISQQLAESYNVADYAGREFQWKRRSACCTLVRCSWPSRAGL